MLYHAFNALEIIILYTCTAQYCIVLYSIVLYSIVLYSIVPTYDDSGREGERERGSEGGRGTNTVAIGTTKRYRIKLSGTILAQRSQSFYNIRKANFSYFLDFIFLQNIKLFCKDGAAVEVTRITSSIVNHHSLIINKSNS